MKNLSNYTILITGASSGIGRELAIRCAQLKVKSLILVARRVEKCDQIKNQFPEIEVITIKTDLSTIEGV